MRFRERLRYDAASGAIYDGDIRYMMIRPDALMGIFARLAPAARAEALAALGASVRDRGKRSAQTYIDGDVAALLRTIEATAPDLGWGIWRFETGETGGFTLSVTNSPFAAGADFEGMMCHAIAGMAASVGELVLGVPCEAHESHCTGAGADTCVFRVEPRAA
ncbi:MAG: hypothetical protein AcusKO_21870 [Acuticoccus sp.]